MEGTKEDYIRYRIEFDKETVAPLPEKVKAFIEVIEEFITNQL